MGVLWQKSGFVERDDNDVRAGGALAYFFAGGTTTPLTVYEDADEATPQDHPVVADANGRWPAVFIPFTTSYDVQVTTAGGTQLYYYEEIPNPDPVEASEDSVDDTELVQTGMFIWMPSNTTLTGFVRANGRTIGSASSGATERANADTSTLFSFLWNNLANGQAAVSGGRGATAAADFAANKTITLPDLRGSGPMGLDDMGNSAAARYGTAPFTHGAATTAGSAVGANTHTITTSHLPGHTHTFSATTGAGSAHSHSLSGATSSDGAHTHGPGTLTGTGSTASHSHTIGSTTNVQAGVVPVISASGTSNNTSSETPAVAVNVDAGVTASSGGHTHSAGTLALGNEAAHTHSVSGTSGSTGSGTAHNIVSLGILGTWFVKL